MFFRAEEVLAARSFDPAKLEFTGEPVVVAPSVTMLSSNGRLGFSVSSNGYLAVNESRPGGQVNNLVWVDRAGKQLAALGKPGDYSDLALSPDGRQLAFTSRQATTSPNIWVFDLTREVPSRITFDNAVDTYAAWTADGRNLLFASNRKGVFQIYTKPASGLGEEQLVFPSTMAVAPVDVSADGRFLLFTKTAGANSRDIYALPLTEKAEPVPVLTSPFDEASLRFSPDGHWIAYASNESGRPQIYVRSFPGSERKVQVSTAGGTQPRWRRDGKELYYLSGDGTMMAVPIKALTPFEPGTPVSLFPTQLLSSTFHADYVVNADGSRFLLNQPVTATSQVPITIVQNWQAGLKK